MKASSSSDSPSGGPTDALFCQVLGGDRQQLGTLLELYRNYLTILASAQLDARLRRRVSPSDLVQETMLGAYRDFGTFRGGTQRELLAWLRQILVNCLRHAYDKHVRAGRRDLRREISMSELDKSLDHSALKLADVLADRQQSPSAPLRRNENAIAVANQLARLSPDYRDVIVMRNLQGLSFEEIAVRMERKPGAVRMLWLRAIEKFRQGYEVPG